MTMNRDFSGEHLKGGGHEAHAQVAPGWCESSRVDSDRCAGRLLITPVDAPNNPSEQTKFTQAVRRAMDAAVLTQRQAALREAHDLASAGLFDPALDCPVIIELEDAVVDFREGPARLVLSLLQLLDCENVPRMVAQAAAGEWRARSGVLRSVALRTLAAGVRRGVWQSPPDLDDLVANGAVDEHELIRAAALDHMLATVSDDDRAALLLTVQRDQSALVRRMLSVQGESQDPTEEGANNAP